MLARLGIGGGARSSFIFAGALVRVRPGPELGARSAFMFAGVLVGVRGGRGVRGPPLGLRSYGIVGERLKESTDRRRAAVSES